MNRKPKPQHQCCAIGIFVNSTGFLSGTDTVNKITTIGGVLLAGSVTEMMAFRSRRA